MNITYYLHGLVVVTLKHVIAVLLEMPRSVRDRLMYNAVRMYK